MQDTFDCFGSYGSRLPFSDLRFQTDSFLSRVFGALYKGGTRGRLFPTLLAIATLLTYCNGISGFCIHVHQNQRPFGFPCVVCYWGRWRRCL
ncbi:hypothetical protein EMPG_13367 [Blastomyces silverae]|uniref:Uncharacterized protein n=1 Tax=Blastomyces silverae TaxID=2060906 RepID=A0A0H1BJ76_9EURO|nr:hypothetical protein EMPG_13367 [Blastomyces silverae]